MNRFRSGNLCWGGRGCFGRELLLSCPEYHLAESTGSTYGVKLVLESLALFIRVRSIAC